LREKYAALEKLLAKQMQETDRATEKVTIKTIDHKASHNGFTKPR
jgi:hypothetical protein